MARVRNTLRQIQTFSLPHAKCCRSECRCHLSSVVNFVKYKDRFVPREESRVIPFVVTLLAGEVKEVPAGFFQAIEVQEALRRGWIEKVLEVAKVAIQAPVEAASREEPPPRRGTVKLRGRRAGKEE